MEGTSVVVVEAGKRALIASATELRAGLQAVFQAFRADREAVLIEAKGLALAKTDEEAVLVAAKRKELGRIIKKLDDAGMDFRKPFREAVDLVIEEVKEFLKPLREVDGTLARNLEQFEDARRARLAKEREEQRKREEEAARDLAALRVRQEAERVALQGFQPEGGSGTLALELQQEEERKEAERLAAAAVGPEVTRSVIEGARLGREYLYSVVDPDSVPRAFCSPDPKLIKAKLDALWKALKDDEPRFLLAARQAVPGLDLCCKSKAARG
jgi:hypothetical protein